MGVITRPEGISRTSKAAVIALVAIGILSAAGYWAFTKVVELLDELECRPSISAQGTGPSDQLAKDAAFAAWKDKVRSEYGGEAADSGITINMLSICSGVTGSYTCSYAAEPCAWKK